MNPSELRSSIALACVFALRMLGLFLIIPIFSLHAKNLPNGDNSTLVGLTIGIYAMVQALLHIPLGMLSDRYGRKTIVAFGLSLFIIGALVAASHDDLFWILAGRAIQGAGAISAAISAWVADSTREEVRTRAMAIIGGSIALSFALSVIIATPLYELLGMSGIFVMMACLGLAALIVTIQFVPSAPMLNLPQPEGTQNNWDRFMKVLNNSQLVKLNLGVLLIHATQVAMFIAIPRMMLADGLDLPSHWKMYITVLILSLVVMAPMLMRAEKKNQLALLLKAGAFFVVFAQLIFFGIIGMENLNLYVLGFGLVIFFTGFNILESLIPSLISVIAGDNRGAGLGIYNTSMSIGLFLGGIMGGWVFGQLGIQAIFMISLGLMFAWWLLIFNMTGLVRKVKASHS
ncbi:MFS transporter [Polynucleobacter kasalickyi]|uniref:Predicted arabinose efflux permease, MFS family n=1 Tax=Polynucleobacter kasalickyi TaxID=1938817 RepID=A0A1W2APV8_9BURK|nr:MFS transporter [Polynucleobacter kasalickyi]SMC62747.1 Predicted arabinose efflux permease, MFS family [Polynucleobacter kasalickyi]